MEGVPVHVCHSRKYCLKDIPQLDTAAVSAYPGGAYYSLAGKPMNMGVVYYDASGVKYAGPRQILYSYVNDFTSMDMINAYVASCDIQPFNGVVHVIRFTNHNFGFDREIFVQKAIGQVFCLWRKSSGGKRNVLFGRKRRIGYEIGYEI